jgi:hypothetical protein
MGSRGDAFDNAACESCFSTLKEEWIKRHRYKSRDQARHSIFRYVETFYNPRRRHSSLGDISPMSTSEVFRTDYKERKLTTSTPADRRPGDPHQLADRCLRTVRRKPRHLLLEHLREPAPVPRPANPSHDHTVPAAHHPRRLRLHPYPPRSEIERPPTAGSFSTVIA